MKAPGGQTRMGVSVPPGVAFEPNNPEESSSGLRATLYQKAPFVVRFGSAIVLLMLAVFATAASTLRFGNPVRVPVRIVAGAPPMDVSLPLGTRVLRMLVQDGDKVTLGQPIATLSAPDLNTVFAGVLTRGASPTGTNLSLTNSAAVSLPIDQGKTPIDGILRAPADGVLSFVAPVEDMIWRPGGRAPLVIVPQVHVAPRAYASIPPDVLGKLTLPERIRIELPGYPSARNGWLEATVTRVAAVSQDSLYMATIRLNKDLRTTRGVTVTVEAQMLGQGEIDTGERRLIDIILTALRNRVSPAQ